MCRCKGKFSTPKLLPGEFRQRMGWLFTGICGENETQTNPNSIAAYPSERCRVMVIVARCFGLVRFVDEIEGVRWTEWWLVNGWEDK